MSVLKQLQPFANLFILKYGLNLHLSQDSFPGDQLYLRQPVRQAR